MKKIFKYFCLAALTMSLASCEIDNQDGPDAGLSGRVFVEGTNELFQTEQGKGNMEIRMLEQSWTGSESVSWRSLNMRMDGTYQNTKLFSGEYLVYPYQGPFYPIPEEEQEVIQIKGQTVKDFYVTPYLKVEWVKQPSVVRKAHPNTGEMVTYITASAKFTRLDPPAREAYKDAVKPNLDDNDKGKGRMFISTTHYVGKNNAVGGYTTELNFGNADEGQEIVFEMVATEPLRYTNMTYWVRCGFTATSDGRYNYTEPVEFFVPAQ